MNVFMMIIKYVYVSVHLNYLKFLQFLLELQNNGLFIFNFATELANFKIFPEK